MNRGLKFLMAVFVLGVMSCSDDSGLEDHLLIGNYLGAWDTAQGAEFKPSIEPYNDNTGLTLFFR
jgi:hypothetical protein